MEEFLQTLKKPDESEKEESKAYEELVRGVNSKIFSLLTLAQTIEEPQKSFLRLVWKRFAIGSKSQPMRIL